MLDTCYWIELKQDSERLTEFKQIADRDDIEVLFSYGNFIDLVKADEQDRLSSIIASTVDVYIPSMDYKGDEYYTSTDPLGLIPDDEIRRLARRDSVDFGEEKTLRFIFRVSGWDEGDMYQTLVHTMKDIYDEHGFDNTKAALFPNYWRDQKGTEKKLLYDHDIDVTEFVRKMASLYRISMMQDNEKVDSNNVADMEICAQAILTECDLILIESKWKNLKLVEKILDDLEGNHVHVDVMDNFDVFLKVLGK